MCGIFAYVGARNDAASLSFASLKQLEYRGYDSWGLAYVDNAGAVQVTKRVGKISQATETFEAASHCALAHTRWATHGGVTEANSHPHSDEAGGIWVVHNGIVENYQVLKAELVAEGVKFSSETDTEVVAHLIARERAAAPERPFYEVVSAVFKRLKGLSAFVVLEVVTQTLVGLRVGSPLLVGKAPDGWAICSDEAALSGVAEQVHYLEDQEMVVVERGQAQLYDAVTLAAKPLTFIPLVAETETHTQAGHSSFLETEIYEQPKVFAQLQAATGEAAAVAKALTQATEVVMVGCGTAGHAALVGSYLLAQLANTKVSVYEGSEFGYFRHLLTKDALVLFFSQSGETIDIIQHASFLKNQGIRCVAITNKIHSSLARMADLVLPLEAGPEYSVLATKSFTAMVIRVLQLSGHWESYETLITATKRVLAREYVAQTIEPVAALLAKQPNIFTIGKGLTFPVAREAAMKIKEVTYIHTEGFAAGELKHGVIALIEAGVPTIVFVPDDEYAADVLSNAMEIKSRGGVVIGVASQPSEIFDYSLPYLPVELGEVVVQSVIAQLLAWKMAVLMGRDPDKPRNLAKSVTVK